MRRELGDTEMSLDYRTGNSTWGNAMHAETMREVTPEGLFVRWKDKLEKAYRVQVMIHSPRHPDLGEQFLWSAKAGHDVHGTVYAVERCRDPKDMYTVFVRVRANHLVSRD